MKRTLLDFSKVSLQSKGPLKEGGSLKQYRTEAAVVAAMLAFACPTQARADCTVPHALVNGQVADASKVMDDINAVAACVDAANDVAVTTTGAPAAGELAVFTGDQTISSGDLTGDVTTSGGTVTELAPSGVTAGIYSNPYITVDAKGRITSAVNGAGAGDGSGFFEIKPPNGAFLFTLTNNSAGAVQSYHDGPKVMSFYRTDTGVAGERTAFRGKAVPAGSSWEATIGFWTTPFGNSGYLRSGLALVENSTGKTLAINYNTQNGAPSFGVYYMSNLNTFGSAPATISNVASGRMPVMFRINYDGTNYIFKISYDFGDSWVTMATVSTASYFTADRIGLWLETFNPFSGQNRMDVFYYQDPDFP